MPQWVNAFWTQFHCDHLKPHGFKKKARTFARARDHYTELFNIQSSAWNTEDENWIFYINVGVTFDSLEESQIWGGFPGAHWGVRIENILPTAPSNYELSQTRNLHFAQDLAHHIEQASQALELHIDEIHELVLSGSWDGVWPLQQN